jgi:GrpB-like predicted nucleotidyltransferase (UPF0157 family)
MGGPVRPGGAAHSGGARFPGRTGGARRIDVGTRACGKADIVLTVIDSADEAGYLPDLEAAGYVLQFREPHWYEHRFLRDRNPDVQVHVFTVGSLEVERMLLFRDRLRTRSEERELYERTKRELAARRWDYIQDYADAKSAVIEEIISRAQTAAKH